MKLLLDTHAALWFLTGETTKLGTAKDMITDKENTIFFSQASVWEIAIKHKKYPESMPISEEEFYEFCMESGMDYLEIQNEHIYQIKTLERKADAKPHSDPFDRLLLAQAKQEGLLFVTHDERLTEYNVNVKQV